VSTPVLEVDNITKTFPIRGGITGRVRSRLQAVVDVSLSIAEGQTLGLVGESGSGKSTLGRVVMRLIDADSGSVRLAGQDITELRGAALRKARRGMHMVFQDPRSSLDPNWIVGDLVGEPLRAQLGMRRAEREVVVRRLLHQVGLTDEHYSRYAYEFSGGQRQRIAIARALALEPKLVVCDEPVSALDVSTQAKVLTILEQLQETLGLTYLFIAHDLAVVHHISDEIAVMYLGRIVERGPADEIYYRPRHPYTEALLSAIPHPDPTSRRERIVLAGEMPSPINPPSGCRFHTRCPYVMDICKSDEPELVDRGDVAVACHLHDHGPSLAGETLVGSEAVITKERLR